jgi:hypothetical protein
MKCNVGDHQRMARQTTVTVTDDLDGSANAQEVSFSLDGTAWTIDLGAKNRAALRKALKPYIARATEQRPSSPHRRRAEESGKTARRARSRSGPADPGEIRAWANNNGYTVSGRGRISAEVQQAYDSARRASTQPPNPNAAAS